MKFISSDDENVFTDVSGEINRIGYQYSHSTQNMRQRQALSRFGSDLSMMRILSDDDIQQLEE